MPKSREKRAKEESYLLNFVLCSLLVEFAFVAC
jgi:hypothetical protein